MTLTEHQQTVLDILKDFRGTDPLKQLFWSELNYSRINTPLSRRGWSPATADVLSDDPTLFATGGDGFHIIHSHLAAEKLLTGQERPVVSQLLKEHPYALFVFSNQKLNRWHFLNVKYDDEIIKRRVFRRITVGPEERLRTASERIAMLDLESVSPDLFGLSPLAIQKRHDEAFDVEPVTKEFFHEYAHIFEQVEGQILGIKDAERKRLFTQRLFNRLMFIAFIQKKGWLKFDKDTDYLESLWRDYMRRKKPGTNFYSDRLKLLFFAGLNTPNEVNVIGINRGGFLKDIIGKVPYLNGGLFEEDEDDRDSKIMVPDDSLGAILTKLFSRFNFTVTESTPLDVEVAVDPEMLGRIFEELVTGRHETGSYYTPKPVVSFMCKEALKGYLRTRVSGEAESAVEKFVDGHDPSGMRNAEAVLEALRAIKVCDPACGSGAYPLGMLHELLDLRACLFATHSLDPISTYQRKLQIIQNNLYGVDIDPFAVNIARLRLWLSLAVDFEGNDPPPLPNLDFKIEGGDSLAAPDPSGSLEQGSFHKALIGEYLTTKSAFGTAHGSVKMELRKKIAGLKETIRGWAHPDGNVSGFDWPVEFAEVFLGGGFDVILANPPYVRMELFKDIKPGLRKNFPQIHSDRADLYCYFYGRGVELLRNAGMLVFISSNKWFRANYGAKLRDYIASNCEVQSITDFGELPIFNAATFPMILVARKAIPHDGTGESGTVYTQVKSLDPPYPDVQALIQEQGKALPAGAINGSTWTLANASITARLSQMESKGIPLREYVRGQIYRGIVTGLNRAFVIDSTKRAELIAQDKKSAEIIKPLAVGDDIRKWRIEHKDRWLIYTFHGIDMKGLTAVLTHLMLYRKELEQRATKQEWYELQQPQRAYVSAFDMPKIVFPDIAKEPRFTLDSGKTYITNTTYFIPVNDPYLLGVLNSNVVWSYARERLAVLGDARNGGRLRFFTQFVKAIPIPVPSNTIRAEITALVQKCLEAEGEGCENWEREINERVSALYGL